MAGASLLQRVVCRPGKTFDAHPKTEGLERKFDVVGEDGLTVSFLLWGGGNAFKASVLLAQFEDTQRNMTRRRVTHNDKYEVAKGEPIEANADVGAIVFVRATPTAGVSPQEFFAAAASLDSLSSIPGATVCFLQDQKESSVGICALCSDADAMGAFLEQWEHAQEEMAWKDVVVDKYTIASVAAPAA